MRGPLFLIALSCLANTLSAQYVYTIKADSVKITSCDSAELIIENHTQGVPGFLFNTGNGRTIFKRALMQLDDSTYLLGTDTLHTNRPSYWKANGNHIYNTNTGNVGIHRDSPNVMLDLPGPVNIDDTSAYRINYHPVLSIGGWVDTSRSDVTVFNDQYPRSYTNLMAGDSSGVNNNGVFCTLIGEKAGVNNGVGGDYNGDGNTFVGYEAGYNCIQGWNNTFAGFESGANSSGYFNNAFFGSWSGLGSTNGGGNTFLGVGSGRTSNGGSNTYVGDFTGQDVQGYGNCFFGDGTGGEAAGSANIFIGAASGTYHTGDRNIFMGSQAAYGTMTGSDNISIGAGSGYFSGDANVIVGNNSVGGINSGTEQSIGSGNVAVGFAAATNNDSSNFNVSVGDSAGFKFQANGAYTLKDCYNTFLGAKAGLYTFFASVPYRVTGVTLVGSNSFLNISDSTGNLSNATAIGANAVVGTSNTIVFGDNSVNKWLFNSSAAGSGGAALVVGNNSTNGNGAFLTTGGVWTNASDRFKKENFDPLDNTDILDKIGQLPVTRWNYKGLSEQHIGPVAQDFYRIFHVGTDDKTISTIDPSGIALAGIQGLYLKWKEAEQHSREQQATIRSQEKEIEDLRTQLQKQQAAIAAQQVQITQLLEKFNAKK